MHALNADIGGRHSRPEGRLLLMAFDGKVETVA
jgi:hypothetical protein